MSGPTASINLISTDPIQLFLSIILTGGIIAGTYEWIRYYLNKRREEAVDMAKHKMDVLMKLLPIYIPLGTYYGSLSVELDPKRGIAPDKKRCFFYICKILILQKCIFDRGGLQLGNLDAEEILTDLGYNIVTAIRKEFGYDMIADLQRLVSQKSQYDSFLAKLNRESKANSLYIKVSSWFTNSDTLPGDQVKNRKEVIIEFAKKGNWYYQLMLIELNRVFKLWYGENPRVDEISNELQKYLVDRGKVMYYNQLLSFQRGIPHMPIPYKLKIYLIILLLSLLSIIVIILLIR